MGAYLSCAAPARGDRSAAAHSSGDADSLYYFRLACAHTAEGVDHVLLKATAPRSGLIYKDSKKAIESWIEQDEALQEIHGAIRAHEGSVTDTMKAFRHASFHYTSQDFGEILDAMADRPWRVTWDGPPTFGNVILEFAAVPTMLAVLLKAKELKAVSAETTSVLDWVGTIADEVGEVEQHLLEFSAACLRKRWCETQGAQVNGLPE